MSDVAALRERILELAEETPADRRQLLSDVSERLSDTEEIVVRAIFKLAAESPITVRESFQITRQQGYSREETLSLLAAAATADDIQAEWASSQDINHRDEALLRLQILARTPSLAGELIPFLTLSLRSPDPLIYQTAAITIGRHLDAHADLLSEIREYAAAQNLALETPTTLSESRANRRVLLIQAAARASPHEAGSPLPDLLVDGLPLDVDAAGSATETRVNPSDVTVLLLATRLLLDVPELESTVGPVARNLVTGSMGDPDATPPLLVQRWGELLTILVEADQLAPSAVADTWSDRLHLVENALRPRAGDHGLSELANTLFLLDEHARVLAGLPASVGRAAASSRTALTPSHRALLDHRVQYWWRRAKDSRPPEGWPQEPVAAPPAASQTLRVLLQSHPTATELGVGATDAIDRDLERIDALLAPFGERSRWTTLSLGERALRVVFLLRLIHDLESSRERVLSLLRTHNIPIPPGDETRSQALAAVILRIIYFEGPATARALDARILESVSDLGVLLTLLPTSDSPGFAADLADNLEHQIRRNLQFYSDFRPIQILVLTTVRDPHPAFYRELQNLVTRWTYTDTGGREVPLAAAVAAIISDLDADGNTDPWQTPTLTATDRLVPARSRARERLSKVTEEDASLWEALDALLEAIGFPTGPRETPPNDTLLGLIGLVHPPDDRMLASGARPWHDETPTGFVNRHAKTVSALRGRLDAIHPEHLGEAPKALDAVQALRDEVDAIVTDLLPVLPQAETERLQTIFERLDTRINSFTQALDSVIGAWDPADPPRSPEQWDQLLDGVTEQWSPPERKSYLWATFASLDTASQNGTGVDSWDARRQFLTWAITAPEERAWTPEELRMWTDATVEVWQELLNAAMDTGQETRVRSLLEQSAFEAIRKHSAAVQTLRAARTWALDRYMLDLATHVRSHLPTSNTVSRTRIRLREAGAFLLHHSTVWTALVVGAILMQDIGDAWQAMAEQGDVQGIVITFILAVTGAFSYVMLTLHRKTTRAPEQDRWSGLSSRIARSSAFVAICWLFTIVVTASLWWLLSGTDRVVHGAGAVLHVAVWSSFALLAGIFLGLVAKAA